MSSAASLIQSLAPSYGIPPSLALAVAQQESGLNQAAIGTSGEIGVFQLMPATAAQLGVDPTNLQQNIDGGLSYLQSLYNQFGNWTQALQAYNGGPGNVQKGTVSAAAQSYAASVLAAAGISDSSNTPDLTQASPTTDLFASVDTLDLSSLTDPNQPAFWGALGVALVVGYALLR
jgi:soluble lytic murein transglycosylase-like protein